MRKFLFGCFTAIVIFICLITMLIISFKTMTRENMNVNESEYVMCEVNGMFADLRRNPLTARETYENNCVKFYGKITDIHNYGYYILVSDTNEEWDYDIIRCVVMNKKQEEVLKTKSIGDTVFIKGRITLIGENIGFNLNIHEVK